MRGHSKPWEWARGVSHLWRTTGDISDRWESFVRVRDLWSKQDLGAVKSVFAPTEPSHDVVLVRITPGA